MLFVTEFAMRQFAPEFGGTKILGVTPEEFIASLGEQTWVAGKYPFLQHVFVPNTFGCKAGVAKITPENKHLLESSYEARTPQELPVLTRRFVGLPPAEAKYLHLVLYSKEQLTEEGYAVPEGKSWGVVAILSTDTLEISPIPPATMIRNAMGISEGGNGVPLDRQDYLISVAYWDQHAVIGGQRA